MKQHLIKILLLALFILPTVSRAQQQSDQNQVSIRAFYSSYAIIYQSPNFDDFYKKYSALLDKYASGQVMGGVCSYDVVDKTSKVVIAMENSIYDILKIKTKHSTAGGTSDARYFGAFGIEAIEFGVINDTIHSINERTTVKEVEGLTEVFENLIKNF